MSDSRTSMKTVWITGGGSGMGRAAALRAAASGWAIAVSGRRADALDAVVAEIVEAGGEALAVPLDVAETEAIAPALERVLERFGRLDALVTSAGLNAPRRTWGEQSMAEFDAILATNLSATAHAIDAALPELRRRAGVVVLISSYSAWRFSPGAGVAYSASKSALASLSQMLNLQEAASGIRACHLCPGDVATDFLTQRPVVPDEAARQVMLSPEDIAASVQFVLDAPAHVRIDELVISPVSQT